LPLVFLSPPSPICRFIRLSFSLAVFLLDLFLLALLFCEAVMAKVLSHRVQIVNFKQLEYESISQAWERMKSILKDHPTHGMKLWVIMQSFYMGLNFSSRQLLESSEGGTFIELTLDEATQLLDNISMLEKVFSCYFLPEKDVDLKMIGTTPIDSLFSKIEIVDKGTGHDPNSIGRCPKIFENEDLVEKFAKSEHEEIKTLSSDAPTIPLDLKDFNYDNCSLIECISLLQSMVSLSHAYE
jgi:hypothetical protein